MAASSVDDLSTDGVIDDHIAAGGEGSPDTTLRNFRSLITQIKLVSDNTPPDPASDGISNDSFFKSQLLYQCLVCAEVFQDLTTILHDHIQDHLPEDIAKARQSSAYSGDVEMCVMNTDETLAETDAELDTDRPVDVAEPEGIVWAPIVYSLDDDTTSDTSVKPQSSPELMNECSSSIINTPRVSADSANKCNDQVGEQENRGRTKKGLVNGEDGTIGGEYTVIIGAPFIAAARPNLTRVEKITKQVCAVCNKGFDNGTSSSSQSGVDDDPRCDPCHRAYVVNRWLLDPERGLPERLRPTSPSSPRCAVCSELFDSSRTLRRHVKTVHMLDIPYECKLCDKSFLTKRAFRDHNEVNHLSEGAMIKCGKCGKSFSDIDKKRNHEKKHRTKSHQCKKCKKVFCRKKDLTAHRRETHQNERPYQCELCPKSYLDDKFLRLHMVSIHKNPEYKHWCGPCGVKYLTRKELHGHEMAVHGPRPKEHRLYCRFCDRVFDVLVTLLQHEQDHLRNQHKPIRFLSSD